MRCKFHEEARARRVEELCFKKPRNNPVGKRGHTCKREAGSLKKGTYKRGRGSTAILAKKRSEGGRISNMEKQ